MPHHSDRPAAHPTPYAALNQVLRELVTRQQTALGDDLVGAYLQGSFALGDFDPHSDVDLVFVAREELAADQVAALQVMHDQVYRLDSPWAQHLEGSYFPRELLKDPARCGADLWYLDHGARSLVRSDHCNTLLVRRVLREHGVTLLGPSPETLLDPISSKALRAEIYQTINYWGQVILGDPAAYQNRFYQGYLVLNFARMLHDLIQGRPGTKRQGAAWAKGALDSSWHDLVDAAWATRPDPAAQVRQPAEPVAYRRTLRFIQHIIDLSQPHRPQPNA